MNTPLISICVPAYKRTVELRRLFHSIVIQTFKDFEIVITDDSPDDSVAMLCDEYKSKLPIVYCKNKIRLGGPANFNYSIAKATGEWIKMMNDDDWFATASALQIFADATKNGNKFIVSGYNNIDDNGKVLSKPALSSFIKKMLERNLMVLLATNYIGQPSVCMVHRSVKAKYDERMKWRVDIDYYMQLLQEEKSFYFIPDVLINLGISSTQVTHSCLNVPGVELPEGKLLLGKYGIKPLKNILVYDAWWRIIRNTNTRSKDTLYQYATEWPEIIERIVEEQQKIKPSLLKKGVISKLCMALSYLKARKYLH
jgi:glycosyltransferase involved in cell wall biosynthesis